tara:strand:+ start:1401 stop:2459 length:1059 start_codon:yes stop_codon:yes gene_type:complete
MKKFALTTIFLNPVYGRDRAGQLEIYYMHKLLTENGYDVDIIGKKGRNNKDLPFYIDWSVADWTKYDGVIVQGTSGNFFGGKQFKHTAPIIQGMADAMPQIYTLATDPLMLPLNPATIINKRFKTHQDCIKPWQDMIDNQVVIFPGKDLELFWGKKYKKVVEFDLFTYIFKDLYKEDRPEPLFVAEKEYDVVYYGRKRNKFRHNLLKNLMPDSTNNLLISYKTNDIVCRQIGALKQHELIDKLDTCKVSLILGDEEHMDNTITFRFFETMRSNCLAAIPIEYDPSRSLIKNPILRELLYIKDQEDVKRLVESYSEDLLELQREELDRILKDFDQKFINPFLKRISWSNHYRR